MEKYYYKNLLTDEYIERDEPITENIHEYEEITEDEYIAKTQPIEISEKELQKIPLYTQIAELKLLLANTDYQAIKFSEGELTIEEFSPIKTQRHLWRAQINELEEQIENIGD